jgi:hypothetical protein
VGADRKSDAAVLKAALHFVAGFVEDIPLDDAQRLLPFILGDDPNIEPFIGAAPFNATITPESWPPHHQITCWTDGEATYVAVMLFDAHPYLCRLPFRVQRSGTFRYRQSLLSATDPILEENVPVSGVEWNARVIQDGANEWGGEIVRRLNRIGAYAQRREILDQAERAGRRAEEKAAGGGELMEWYRAELQLECVPAEQVHQLVRIGAAARRRGQALWDIEVAFATDGP